MYYLVPNKTGNSVITGNGDSWWDADGLLYGRPRLIEPMFCSDFVMANVTVVDPPFWVVVVVVVVLDVLTFIFAVIVVVVVNIIVLSLL